MDTPDTQDKALSPEIIKALGGLAEIARLVLAPKSTVNSWKEYIPASRLDHLILRANAAGITVPWHTLREAKGRGGQK